VTFEALFVPADYRKTVADGAWLEAMLEAERALANAESLAGVVPVDAAKAIADACRPDLFDAAAIVEAGRAVGNPAEPLVRALRERVGGDAATYVHWGATSQDIVDTAAMLVTGRARSLIVDDLARVAAGSAELAQQHREAVMAGRTLLQQAVPTTFGLRAAQWLLGVLDASAGLRGVELPAQLGGAAGTLAPLGDRAGEVRRLFAAELELAHPELPWHTNRVPIARIAAALDVCAGVLAKIALDVILLAQTEVGEVAEHAAGGSSTMPQKRNPVGSALTRACAAQVHAHAGVLTAGLAQELDRGAGGWHAEWPSLSAALAFAGGAAAAVREVVEGLEVNTARMRANLRPETASERLAFALAQRHGREEAHRLVATTPAEELDVPGELLDPTTNLGSAGDFVDAALDRYGRQRL
jgi:3-carboxy-cis,cis-muconate cycloisomerase